MFRKAASNKALQFGFIGLLITCFAQAAYWVVDHANYTDAVREELIDSYEREVGLAQQLLDNGAVAATLCEKWPHIEIDGRVARISTVELDRLTNARLKRLRRYGWEGSFFLLVLLGGIGVITAALRQREHLLRRQENFVSAVSHEFKSPLASLRLSAETLARRQPDAEATERLSTRMIDDVYRLEAMVTNILDAARMDERRSQLNIGTVELGRSVAHVTARASCQAVLRSVQVSSSVPAEALVRADGTALDAVLENLVRNAIKSVAANGGGTVHTTATLDGGDWRIEVTDDGLGFERNEAPHLFEKFYRAGDEIRRRTQGSGLGLYIVEQFVKQHGGRVQAHSPGPGQGATFQVWWRAAKEDQA